MISLNNKLYCNSHYRTLIQTCNKKGCHVFRDTNELCHDKLWYCEQHKLDENEFKVKMFLYFQNNLPIDIINKIAKNHLKSKPYRV